MERSKLALITGGSRGLGAALCEEFIDKGYQVVEFSRRGATGYSVNVNLADPVAADHAFKRSLSRLAMNEYDSIVGINNAAVLFPMGPAARKPLGEVKQNLNVNFVSQILFIRSFLENFQKHPCRKILVNISSGAALKGYSGWSLYCASKSGIENFIRAVAIEQADEQYPIIAFNIDPGIMDTDMQADIRASSLVDFPDLSRFVSFKESGALEKPSDVAKVIVRLIHQHPSGGDRLSVAEIQDR